jgi:hypothetical protein
MGDFDSLDTATRVRDIIKKGADRQIQTIVPRPLVGRVVTVDLPNLRAMVWFPGDEQPVEVRMFSSTVPGQWATRGYPQDVTNTDTQGFGSMAVVQRFNGVLYMTDVITGGQFAYQLNAAGFSAVSLLPNADNGELGGSPTESLMVNVTSSDTTVSPGDAVRFGPFVTWNNADPQVGAFKVKVNSGAAVKEYEFTLSFWDLVDPVSSTNSNDRWFRIIPTRSIGDTNASLIDWDFDVSFRETVGGQQGLFQSSEIWFRLVNRNATANNMNFTVVVYSDMVQRGIGWDNHYVAEKVVSPPDVMGYVGFDNAQAGFRDISNWGLHDNFGRSADLNGSVADTGEVWTTLLGPLTTDGAAVASVMSAAGDLRVATVQPTVDGNTQNVTVNAEFSTPVVATGADIRCYVIYRLVDVNNYYDWNIVFSTAGTVGWRFNKTVAGSTSNIANGTTGITYSANQVFSIRATVNGSSHSLKVWATDTTDEPATNTTSQTDTAISATGANGIRFLSVSGNTNTYPFTLKCHRFVVEVLPGSKVRYTSAVDHHSGAWETGLRNLAARVQHTLVWGDIPIWDGSNITWTGSSVRIGGAMRHRSGLLHGSYVCFTPATGYSVPIIPGSGFATVVSGGIPLAQGQTLWVAIPPGRRFSDVSDYLFITDDTVFGKSNTVPEWAVMLCHRAVGQTNVVRMGDGTNAYVADAIENGVQTSPLGGTTSTATGAFVNMGTGSSFTFIKTRLSTRLYIEMHGTFYTSDGSLGGIFGVNINSTDYEICREVGAMSVSAHETFSGVRTLGRGVIPANSYTIQGRMKSQGANTITMDTGDHISIWAREIP